LKFVNNFVERISNKKSLLLHTNVGIDDGEKLDGIGNGDFKTVLTRGIF
jgi:hypothetical protein